MLVLFDIDGTLTTPMGVISDEMIASLRSLRAAGHTVGIVGGSDRSKAVKQVGEVVLDDICEVAFHENGCVVYRGGRLAHTDTLEDFVSPEELNRLISFLLTLIAGTDCPWRTGTFIERRHCMLNISPVGRACPPEVRRRFGEWDAQTGCRAAMVRLIRAAFPELPIELAIGGEISIDLFPAGMNKTRCLAHLGDEFGEIHFVGDRVDPGGNDHELHEHPRVRGHRTTGPADTQRIIAGWLLDEEL
jgi:phosphomannomutase